MNLQLRFIHFASLAFELFHWLHAKYIGIVKDLILSSRTRNLSLSWHATRSAIEFVKAQNHMLKQCHLTLIVC